MNIIDKLKELEAAATQGKWWVNHAGPHWNNPGLAHLEICWSEDAECVCDTVYEPTDANLIVALRALAPELLGLWEAVQRQQEAPEGRKCHSSTLCAALDALEAKAATINIP